MPLILLLFFNFKCKFVLRISGLPKLTILRKFLWKLSSKKLHKVSTPTKDTMNMLINKNIFQSNMICLVRDPIINISEINLKIREKIFENLEDKKYIINVGRLTKQKNQEFLIDGFKILKEKFPNLKLIILGEGELETKLINKSKKMNLQNDIKFLGFKDNVYKYYRRSICFTLTSAWEDPGFVLIEAAASKIPIISSDCNNGPKEFIKSNYNGYLYKNYDLSSFIETFENFMFDLENEKNKLI